MEHHAVPRQVTTFEFKLIGWFTVKQFIYLLIFAGLTVIVYFVIPVPILNIFLAVLTALFGIGLVFYKYNERPLDVWIVNLFKSLLTASQYYYQKQNEIPAFLQGVYLATDEQMAQTHIDANKKLTNYMAQTGQQIQTPADKQNVNTLIHTTPAQQQTTQAMQPGSQPAQQADAIPTPAADAPTQQVQPSPNTPFLSGIIRNNKEEALPNIMVYINSDAGQVVRILKSNHNGIFATFHPLPTGTYILSPKDLGGTFFFDTMNVTVDGPLKEPLQIFSKELL